MTDKQVPTRPPLAGRNERVPVLPMSEWKIKTIDHLPDHLKRRLDALPPYLPTKRAMEESGEGTTKLHAAAGCYRAVKSGATTLWETASILLYLANLPAAHISMPSPRRSPLAASHPVGSRRSRRQPVSRRADAATPPAPERTTAPDTAASSF